MTLQRWERRQGIFAWATRLALIASILFLIFGRTLSLMRILTAVVDIVFSIGFYFCTVFHLPFCPPATVNAIPVPLDVVLPFTWAEFADAMCDYVPTFFDLEIFFKYIAWLLGIVNRVASLLNVLWPCLVALLIWLYVANASESKLKGDSRFLRAWKWIRRRSFGRARVIWRQYLSWVRPRRGAWIRLLVVWVLITNVATIALEFVAWFLYFAACFDFFGLYIQVVRLLVDLLIMLRTLPWYVWLVVAYIVYDRIRCMIADRRLKEYQKANREFVKDLPTAVMITGTMGANKTTLLTSLLLEIQDLFRSEGLDRMFKINMRYPAFPIAALEHDIDERVRSGKIKALRDIRKYMRHRAREYERHPDAARCYGYDVQAYRTTFNDALTVRQIFRDLEEYACLYYIYSLDCSLILTSYAVRGDRVLKDKGYFRLWKMDALHRDPRKLEEESQYSKILNYDFLRLGRRFVPDDQDAPGFEFGAIGVAELGKERQNNLELQSVKKSDVKANQKNDGFNLWLKTGRHPSTVDYFPFFRFLGDDQRASSWGADARDTAQLLHVRKSEKIRCELPGIGLIRALHTFASGAFKKFFYECRSENEYHTLGMHAVTSLIGAISRRYERIYNRYGVIELHLELEAGDLEGEKTPATFYLLPKVIYADRFATDCYRGFYAERGKHATKGMLEYEEYKGLEVDFATLEKQRSYLNNMMMGLFPEGPSKGEGCE